MFCKEFLILPNNVKTTSTLPIFYSNWKKKTPWFCWVQIISSRDIVYYSSDNDCINSSNLAISGDSTVWLITAGASINDLVTWCCSCLLFSLSRLIPDDLSENAPDDLSGKVPDNLSWILILFPDDLLSGMIPDDLLFVESSGIDADCQEAFPRAFKVSSSIQGIVELDPWLKNI